MSLRETNRDTPRIVVRQKTESQAFDSKKCLAITFLFLAVVGMLVGSLGFGRVGELSRLGMLGSGLLFGVSVIAVGICISVLKHNRIPEKKANAGKKADVDKGWTELIYGPLSLDIRIKDIYSGNLVKKGMDTKGFDFELNDRLIKDLNTGGFLAMRVYFKAVDGMAYIEHSYPQYGIEVHHWIDCNTKKQYAVMRQSGVVKHGLTDELKALIVRMQSHGLVPPNIPRVYGIIPSV